MLEIKFLHYLCFGFDFVSDSQAVEAVGLELSAAEPGPGLEPAAVLAGASAGWVPGAAQGDDPEVRLQIDREALVCRPQQA